MQTEQKILVLRIGWMEFYQGSMDDPIHSNATFVREKRYGYEMYNFLPEHGKIYGHVQPSGNGEYQARQININRLGAKSSDDSIDHILVAWVAPRSNSGVVLVGWYEDATVYRRYQLPNPNSQRTFNGEPVGYQVSANIENCVLLKPHERVLFVPKAQGNQGGFGQSLVWFANSNKPNDRKFYDQLIAFIQAYRHQEFEVVLNNTVYVSDHFIEGVAKQTMITVYERNLKAREACVAYYGLRCVICQFDFAKVYGQIGENYIHVHHLNPVASRKDEISSIDPIKDLRPVCPNCHAMIHRRNPPYSLAEIEQCIRKTE